MEKKESASSMTNSLILKGTIFFFFFCNVKEEFFPGGSDGKQTTCNLGDLASTPGCEDPLEKGPATHSSILAWRISWTEEPGRLQSMGSQRVRHDRATKNKHMLFLIF